MNKGIYLVVLLTMFFTLSACDARVPETVVHRHPVGEAGAAADGSSQTAAVTEGLPVITFNLYNDGQYDQGSAYDAYVEAMEAPSQIPLSVQRSPFQEEFVGEFDPVWMYSVRTDDTGSIYYLDSRFTYTADSAREDQYIVKFYGDGAAESPLVGGMDYVLSDDGYERGRTEVWKVRSVHSENPGGVMYKPAYLQNRIILDYLFIPGDDMVDGMWFVLNAAGPFIGTYEDEPGVFEEYEVLHYTYSLYDRDFNPIATDILFEDAAWNRPAEATWGSRIEEHYKPDSLYAQLSFYDDKKQAEDRHGLYITSLAYIRCWYYNGCIYFKNWFNGLYVLPITPDATQPQLGALLADTRGIWTMTVTDKGIMHVIAWVENVGRQRRNQPGNSFYYIRIDVNTGEEIDRTPFKDMYYFDSINRQLTYCAGDGNVYYMSHRDKLDCFTPEEPGYKTMIRLGQQTLFNLNSKAYENYNFFSDFEGSLYVSALDTYEGKTVLYKLTVKEE